MERGGVVMMCSTIAPPTRSRFPNSSRATTLPCSTRRSPAARRAPRRERLDDGGGKQTAFARVADVLEANTANLFRVGAHCGDGSKVKVVNNMLAGVNLAAGCEAMALGEQLGLDPGMLYEVICASSGASWMSPTA